MADILIIDDQDRTISMCQRFMPEHRYRGPARSWKEAAEQLARSRGRVQLVLLDVHFDIEDELLEGWNPTMPAHERDLLKRSQGLHILERLRARYPELPVIVMTRAQDIRLEEQPHSKRIEEYTYFLDDESLNARALRGQIAAVVEANQTRLHEGPLFWGRSLVMRRIRQKLKVVSRGRLPVVLLGETGTGKSLVARNFVHRQSQRRGSFVSVDLATLPKELMAAHLFGSVKGAYTGAVADRVGAFEAANGGTLFLDEIGNLTLDAQKLLLSVLQEGRVTRIGDVRERPVDVKLVVATNEDLKECVESGSFRRDLWMRLNPAVTIQLPPLRERSLDFESLVQFTMQEALKRPYLHELVRDYRQEFGISRGDLRAFFGKGVPDELGADIGILFPSRTMRLLKRHEWPGNLREFAMVIENALLFSLSEMLGVETSEGANIVQIRPRLIRDLLGDAHSETSGFGGQFQISISPQESLNKVATFCERQYFEALYLREGGDFGKMATVLLGDQADARKVQLRLNQLGLKVRELKERLS